MGSGVRNLSGTAFQMLLSCSLEFCNQIEGETAVRVFRNTLGIEKPLCEKKLAGPCSTDHPACNHSLLNARSTIEYLIGQQRPQFMPHHSAKSRAKSNLWKRWVTGAGVQSDRKY